MQIEVGKFYKTRDGRKVGPMRPSGLEDWPWIVTKGDGKCWHDDGSEVRGTRSGNLIAEWQEYETGRWYPWTGGECPVDEYATVSIMMRDGDIVAEASACSLVWQHCGGGGGVIAFRVDAYPERVERVDCMRYGLGDDDPVEKGTCIKSDGVIDWSTWEEK